MGLKVMPIQGADEPLCLIVAHEVADQEDAGHMQANFLSTLAHELPLPLNTMHGYLDLSLMGVTGELNIYHREFVQRPRTISLYFYDLLDVLLLNSRTHIWQARLNHIVITLQVL